jgi:hypothetical protein
MRPMEDDRQLEAGTRNFPTASSKPSAVRKVAAIGNAFHWTNNPLLLFAPKKRFWDLQFRRLRSKR